MNKNVLRSILHFSSPTSYCYISLLLKFYSWERFFSGQQWGTGNSWLGAESIGIRSFILKSRIVPRGHFADPKTLLFSQRVIRREDINNVPYRSWSDGKKWRLASTSAQHTWSVCKIIITLAVDYELRHLSPWDFLSQKKDRSNWKISRSSNKFLLLHITYASPTHSVGIEQ